MCGRFGLYTSPGTLTPVLGELRGDIPAPRYNIAPSTPVLAARVDARGLRYLSALRWGLIPFWAKDTSVGNRMINARAESVATKPAFRAAYRKRRCVIPADGFYEWRGPNGTAATGAGAIKQPYFLHPVCASVLCFAGLWESWASAAGERIESCTIVTTVADHQVRFVHDRMPLMLRGREVDVWLSDSTDEALGEVLTSAVAPQLQVDAVSRFVNSPGNDDARCIAPRTDS